MMSDCGQKRGILLIVVREVRGVQLSEKRLNTSLQVETQLLLNNNCKGSMANKRKYDDSRNVFRGTLCHGPPFDSTF